MGVTARLLTPDRGLAGVRRARGATLRPPHHPTACKSHGYPTTATPPAAFRLRELGGPVCRARVRACSCRPESAFGSLGGRGRRQGGGGGGEARGWGDGGEWDVRG